MKDKVVNITPEFRGSLRPHSTYASSASSTSSYASSLSSASSASSSSGSGASESLKSPSFLHSKASQVASDGSEPTHSFQQLQHQSLGAYPTDASSCTTPHLSTPSPSSPSSSPASSTFDGYSTIPAKFSTLTGSTSNSRQHSRIPSYTDHQPSVSATPHVNNFRHSVAPTGVPTFADPVIANVPLGSNYNLTRVNLDFGSRGAVHGCAAGNVGGGFRGVSSLGEVTSASRKAHHYASTPHLFVFQSVDDDDEDDEGDDLQVAVPDYSSCQVTKCNTLDTRKIHAQGTQQMIVSKTSRTLPRPPPAAQHEARKEPIYSSTAELKINPTQREEAWQCIAVLWDGERSHGLELLPFREALDQGHGITMLRRTCTHEAQAAWQISEHYEAPRALSATRRSSSCSMISQENLAVTNQVVARIETSFRGHKTQLWVCRTMANLYIEEGSGKDATWKLKVTGVPLLLLDLGETKSRDKRRLQIILAEKESGFELWKDVIDNLTSYKVQEPSFHTMYLSSDHRCKIGLSFNEGPAAMVFHSHLETLISNPENIALSAPGKKKSKNKSKDKPPKYKAPRKTDISKPCNFHHVTTVDPTDRTRLYSLQLYGGKTNAAVGVDQHLVTMQAATAATAV